MQMAKKMRVAIVHDYIRTYGGGEVVLRELHKMWPEAPIFVTTADFKGMGVFEKEFKKMPIKTTWVQCIPLFRKKPILYRAVLPWTWRSIDLSKYDLVISSSGSNMAKLVQPRFSALHLCYCHTPPRFLYGYRTESGVVENVVIKILLKPLVWYLKKADKNTSRIDYFIANSQNTRMRISRFYKRKSQIIYPPCDVPKKFKGGEVGDYYLVVSRLERNKNIDTIVKAANMAGFKLIIIGSGKQEKKLRKLARKNVMFKGQLENKEVSKYYKNCKAFIVAASDEDFGITPVEAMGYGKAVIAYYSGGFRETIVDGKTGVFFKKLSSEAITKAVRKLEKSKIKPMDCYRQAEKFSRKIFREKFKSLLTEIHKYS